MVAGLADILSAYSCSKKFCFTKFGKNVFVLLAKNHVSAAAPQALRLIHSRFFKIIQDFSGLFKIIQESFTHKYQNTGKKQLLSI